MSNWLRSAATVTILFIGVAACGTSGHSDPGPVVPSGSAVEPGREGVRLLAEAISAVHTRYIHELPPATLGLASLRGLEAIPPKGTIRLVEKGADVLIVHISSDAPEASVSLPLSALRSVPDVVRALTPVMEFVAQRTASSEEDIARALVRGLIGIDPHGRYWQSREVGAPDLRASMWGVDWRRLGAHQGYLRIRQLRDESPSEARAALDALRAARATGIVLDLRGNGGGVLTVAVEIAELFLPDSYLLTYTEGRARNEALRFSAHARQPTVDPALVVLVDEGTAAGAEIIAGALQDWKRATLVGVRTAGRASLQTMVPLPDRSVLKLTTSQWFTPRGRSVERRGLTPDIEIASAAGVGQSADGLAHDVQLQRAIETLTNPSLSTRARLPPCGEPRGRSCVPR